MDVKSKEKKTITMRSSAAEYLTFLASGGKSGVEAIYADESIWLTQKMMSVLYDVEPHTISEHISKIYKDSELDEKETHRNFRLVRMEGSRHVESRQH